METSKSKRTKYDHCKVCGDEADYSYYGVVVCEPCKMFFKRYAENPKKIRICKFDDQCEISFLTRHVCTSCRLKKCFQCGMQSERIRHNNRTYRKRESQITMKSSLIPRNELLQNKTSGLTRDQWTLFGNLINSYDLSKLLQISQQFNSEANRTAIVSIQPIDSILAQEFLGTLYEETGRMCRKNVDLQNLPHEDRSIFLHTAAENTICLAAIYIFAQENLFDHKSLMNYMENLYGFVPMKYHRWAQTFVQHDTILFKLALSLFSVLPISRILSSTWIDGYSNVKSILQIEHKYTTLTWEYLLYKYDFREAVRRYFSIIRWYMAMTVFIHHARSAQTHVNDMENLIEQTELNLILDDVNKMIDADE